jgi:hypothetical protein
MRYVFDDPKDQAFADKYSPDAQLHPYFIVRRGNSWHVATLRGDTIVLVDGPYVGPQQASGNSLIRGH